MTDFDKNKPKNVDESLQQETDEFAFDSSVTHPQSDDPIPIDSDLELLTSYLDGELEPAAMQDVEMRLAVDIDFRHRLQELQKTWDLLDELPLSEPTQSFTKSTIELVVQDATREAKRQRQNVMTWLFRAAVIIALPLLAFVGSQALTSYIQSAENRKLAEDLPLIENIDIYKKAESVEFLMALDKSRLFADNISPEDLFDEE